MSESIEEVTRFEPVPDPRPFDEPWPEMVWPIPADTELTGTSVLLTPLDPAADTADLFRALDHDEVWAHVPWRPSDPDEFRTHLEARCALPDWQVWTVRTRATISGVPAGTVVGVTAYLAVSARDAALEIGFTLYDPQVWATTVNPEAKLLLLEFAFEKLNVGRVQLKTDVRNHRSQQAIARLGARYEGVLRRNFRRSDGTIRDSVQFSIIAEDWPETRARLTARL
ncbi:GNAT family N-acetyltransferase [Nocardia inohanensis]|uniref:GNAT family N-acetyltransferase n=1 Tax=Nocardia inohanensis TaxID=209246 RepID=UPI000B1209AE|nr:GNAT family protein [Nocardia inohanensis]